jgi:alpha-aminoadipic semialdehyde synthase
MRKEAWYSLAHRIGIRREDMYAWERRAPLTPQDAKELVDNDLEIVAQSSDRRVFTDADYCQAGIEVADDLASCPIVFGIKEIPIPVLELGKTYVFFSHTIKGQAYNMPMLRKILDMGCTLIDYEKVTDENGRRLIFFGNYAGLAGMIETLWTFGKRLAFEGTSNPFEKIERALDYPDLGTAKEAIRGIGEQIEREGLPNKITPLVLGIAGYGNVSRGAQEILDLLPVTEIAPGELAALNAAKDVSNRVVYKVVFAEEDMVERREGDQPFDLQEYYDHPQRYRGVFERYLPHLDILVNCIYWEPRYPRLFSKETVRRLYHSSNTRLTGPRLKVIADITCDVEGAIECTVKATEPDNPVYVYDPVADKAIDGIEGDGPVVMAVEILPSELPRESSAYFSGVLKGYVPAIAAADYSGDFASCNLPPEIKRAMIVYHGELTPDYRYIEKYL